MGAEQGATVMPYGIDLCPQQLLSGKTQALSMSIPWRRTLMAHRDSPVFFLTETLLDFESNNNSDHLQNSVCLTTPRSCLGQTTHGVEA